LQQSIFKVNTIGKRYDQINTGKLRCKIVSWNWEFESVWQQFSTSVFQQNFFN